MPPAPRPYFEAERLQALRDYSVLDTAPEDSYDELAELASLICATPIALITLVDDQRQWFKARKGLGVQETPRDEAFCGYAILGPDPLVVSDASEDPRFADNPLVTGDPGIRFYAGAPLTIARGFALGTLCVIDRMPRTLTAAQLNALQALARQVVTNLELRRLTAQASTSPEQAHPLRGLLPICGYCKRIRDDHGSWQEVEGYIRAHAPVEFSHGICPQCFGTHFPAAAAEPPAPA